MRRAVAATSNTAPLIDGSESSMEIISPLSKSRNTTKGDGDSHVDIHKRHHPREYRGILQGSALVGFCFLWLYFISFSFTNRISASTTKSQASKVEEQSPIYQFPPNETGKHPLSGPLLCHKENQCWVHFPDSCEDEGQVCLLTHKGFKPPMSVPNQDRSLILQLGPRSQMLALFDGHGDYGHLTSYLALQDLPFRILQGQQQVQHQMQFSQQQQQQLDGASIKLLKQTWTKSFLAFDAGPISKVPYAGTTGIVVYQQHHLLVVASVGDSTSLVVVSNKGKPKAEATIVLESIHHKPALDEERQRIEGRGGQVYIPPVEDLQQSLAASSRVLLPGPLGPGSYALAMSRSLGDNEGKVLGYLLAEPAIQVLDLNELLRKHGDVGDAGSSGDDNLDAFVVVASDGVLDVIDKQFLVQTLSEALAANKLKETCRTLMNKVIAGWDVATHGTYRDDVSLLVAKLQI